MKIVRVRDAAPGKVEGQFGERNLSIEKQVTSWPSNSYFSSVRGYLSTGRKTVPERRPHFAKERRGEHVDEEAARSLSLRSKVGGTPRAPVSLIGG